MQAYPNRGHRECYYSVVEEEIVEDRHKGDNYHCHDQQPIKPHSNQQWYPQQKHEMIHGYEGRNAHKHGHENNGGKFSEATYYEEEEYRGSWNEGSHGFMGRNNNESNKHHMNKFVSSDFSGMNHGGGGGGGYGGYRAEHHREQPKGKSMWSFKGIVD